MLLLLLAQAVVAQPPLNLTCFGGGTTERAMRTMAHKYGHAYGSFGMTPVYANGSSTTSIWATQEQPFQDQVDVRLFSGDDRIRLPRVILPTIHGGSDGWIKLKDVKADARSIEAKAAINFINNPRIHIDRVTGTISIHGKQADYAGRCQAVAADAPPKF